MYTEAREASGAMGARKPSRVSVECYLSKFDGNFSVIFGDLVRTTIQPQLPSFFVTHYTKLLLTKRAAALNIMCGKWA